MASFCLTDEVERFYFNWQYSYGVTRRRYQDMVDAQKYTVTRGYAATPRQGGRRRGGDSSDEPDGTQDGKTYHNVGGYGRSKAISSYYLPSQDEQASSATSADALSRGMGRMPKADLDIAGTSPQYSSSSKVYGQLGQEADYPPVVDHDHLSMTIPTTNYAQWPSTADALPNPYAASYQSNSPRDNQASATAQHPSSNNPRHIVRTASDDESLNKNYRVRNKDYQKFFSQGRVFTTLWTDAVDRTVDDTFITTKTFYNSYGEKVHSKIRRFVVVRQSEDGRSSICLPVTTYDGRGYKKRGIDLNEHGIIYSQGHPPKITGITKQPLKVIPSKNAEALVNAYVNYAKVYTMESNVKVKNIGELDDPSKKLLRKYYKYVMYAEGLDEVPERNLPSTEDQLIGVGMGISGSTTGQVSQGYYGTSTVSTGVSLQNKYYNLTGNTLAGPPLAPSYDTGHEYPWTRSEQITFSNTYSQGNYYGTLAPLYGTAKASPVVAIEAQDTHGVERYSPEPSTRRQAYFSSFPQTAPNNEDEDEDENEDIDLPTAEEARAAKQTRRDTWTFSKGRSRKKPGRKEIGLSDLTSNPGYHLSSPSSSANIAV